MGTVAVNIKDVATLMPLTARWVKGRREAYGHPHVNEQIKRAMAGERDRFFAVEAGHQFGAPFTLTTDAQYMLSTPLLGGASFLAIIREPDNVAHAVVGVPGLEVPDAD
jgi:hypothetical protein